MSVKELSYCIEHHYLINDAQTSCEHNTCRLLGMEHLRKKVEKTAENRAKKLEEFFEEHLGKAVGDFKKIWNSEVKTPVVEALDSLENWIVSKIKARFSWNVEERQDFPTLDSKDLSSNESVYQAIEELLRDKGSRVVPSEINGGSQSVYGEETLENLAEKVNFRLNFNGLSKETIENSKREIEEIRELLLETEGLKGVLLGSLKKLTTTVRKWDNNVETMDVKYKFFFNKKDLNKAVATPALTQLEKSVFQNDESMQDDAPSADSDSDEDNSALNSKRYSCRPAATTGRSSKTPDRVADDPPESESNSVSVSASASASVSASVSGMTSSQRQLVRLLELVANDFSGPEIPPKTPKDGVKRYFERFSRKLQDIQQELLRNLES